MFLKIKHNKSVQNRYVEDFDKEEIKYDKAVEDLLDFFNGLADKAIYESYNHHENLFEDFKSERFCKEHFLSHCFGLESDYSFYRTTFNDKSLRPKWAPLGSKDKTVRYDYNKLDDYKNLEKHLNKLFNDHMISGDIKKFENENVCVINNIITKREANENGLVTDNTDNIVTIIHDFVKNRKPGKTLIFTENCTINNSILPFSLLFHHPQTTNTSNYGKPSVDFLLLDSDNTTLSLFPISLVYLTSQFMRILADHYIKVTELGSKYVSVVSKDKNLLRSIDLRGSEDSVVKYLTPDIRRQQARMNYSSQEGQGFFIDAKGEKIEFFWDNREEQIRTAKDEDKCKLIKELFDEYDKKGKPYCIPYLPTIIKRLAKKFPSFKKWTQDTKLNNKSVKKLVDDSIAAWEEEINQVRQDARG